MASHGPPVHALLPAPDAGSIAVEAQVIRDARDIMVPLPRGGYETSEISDYVAQREEEALKFRPTSGRASRSFLIWMWMGLRYLGGNFADRLMFRDSDARRAVRMRKLFEGQGGAIQKLGQKISMRIDILTWDQCVELSRMTEDVKPMPIKKAVQSVERASGRAFTDLFSKFDPEPVDSETMSCTYHAVLYNGLNVAVKVRRPGAAGKLLADLKSLSWFLNVAEFLTLVPPGFTDGFVHDLEDSVKEELNFLKESRYQELFRKRCRKKLKKRNHYTSPRVLFDICDTDVIIEEVLPGIRLKEIYRALEEGDAEALNYMRQLHIQPKKLAERILDMSFFGMLEDIFFVADPDPDDILILPKGKISFTNFSSCGALMKTKVMALQQLSMNERSENIQAMVQAAISLLEPLPPIDGDELAERLEMEFKEALYEIKNKSGKWQQRTTTKIWMSIMEAARDYQVQMDPDTIRMIRSCMLYDNLASRLHHKMNYFKRLDRFMGRAAGRARRRVRKRGKKALKKSSRDRMFLMMEQGMEMGSQMVFRLQRMMNVPAVNFGSVIGKWSAVMLAVQSIVSNTVTLTVLGVLGFVVSDLYGFLRGGGSLGAFSPDFLASFDAVIATGWYKVCIVIFVLLGFRKIRHRLSQKDED